MESVKDKAELTTNLRELQTTLVSCMDNHMKPETVREVRRMMNHSGPSFSKNVSIGDSPTTPSSTSSFRSCLADVTIAGGFSGFPADVDVERDFSNIDFEHLNMSKLRWRGLEAEKMTQLTARMETVELEKRDTKTATQNMAAQNIWPAQEKDETLPTVEDLDEATDEAPEEAEEVWFLLLMEVCELLLVFM
jgi:hypothetical protein